MTQLIVKKKLEKRAKKVVTLQYWVNCGFIDRRGRYNWTVVKETVKVA